MKTFFTACLLLGLTLAGKAQDPVHFTYALTRVDDTHFEFHITAVLNDGWHLYSQTQPKQAVAQPTQIRLTKNPLLIIPAGKPKEIGQRETYENKEVDIKQYQYAHKVEFVQPIVLKAKVKTNLGGTVTYQVCTDERCLPVKTIPFSVAIP